mgnify:CR=1 FL=1
MTKKSGVPAIRFKGFTDTWEQRELGEISESFEYGLNAAATEYDGKHKYIRITDIDDSTHLFLQDNLTSPDVDFSTVDDYLLQKGDVLFARTGASVGKTYIYRPSDGDLYFAGFLIRAKIKSDYDADFIFQNTLTDNYDSYIRITSQRSGQPGVNAQEYANFALSVPCLAEQKKIGAYFTNLDNLITLHQRKLEKLHNLKKAMLAKMFPQNGSVYPEIRFAGFTDAWEQRKLGEIADIIGGGTPSTSNSEYWDGEIDWYSPTEISDKIYVDSSERKITKAGYENSSAKILPVGTVLFTSRAGIGKTAILRKEACTNQGFQSIVPNKNMLDSYFIFSRTDELKKYGETNGAGSTFVEVSGKQMANMKLMMPKSINEQQKIGGYFRNLDSVITLHQRKLEKLQNIKKSMLEKMFV